MKRGRGRRRRRRRRRRRLFRFVRAKKEEAPLTNESEETPSLLFLSPTRGSAAPLQRHREAEKGKEEEERKG